MLQQHAEKQLVKQQDIPAPFQFSLKIQNEENISYENTEGKKKEGSDQCNPSFPF